MSLDTVHSAVIELHSSTEVMLFKINFLPPELLPKIFKRLNAHDRKNVRLTCRLWNEVCNVREIIESEKFVFHPSKKGCRVPNLRAHIERCNALRSCLEFQGLPLCRLPSTLWANRGNQVQSLFIHECELDDATISNIIIHCTNLKILHLQSVVDYRRRQPCAKLSDSAGEFFTKEGINELMKRKIERRNLTSLMLCTHKAVSLSTRQLQKLFQIFPCLQTLGHGILIFQNASIGIDLCHHRKIELVSPPTMENFISDVEDDILNFLKRSNSKLKEFSTFLDFNSATQYDFFLDFCDKQKELEKLALDVASYYDDGTDILFLILKSFPKLKELEFHVDLGPIFWYLPEKLSEFFVLTTKLKSMWLNFSFNPPKEFTSPVIPSSVIPLSPLAEYSELKSLTVSEKINPNLIYEILRRCRTSLHHLNIEKVNDEIIKIILEAHVALQTELKTLSIPLVDLCEPNEDGSVPEGKKYPFGKLRNLEYLRLVSIDHDTLRNNKSEFIFPKLQYFEFLRLYPWNSRTCFVAQDFHTMLRVVCKGAPYLVTLKIPCVFKWSDFVNHFTNVQMKCLRYITIHRNPNTGQVLTTQLGQHFDVFNVCPSLCSIKFVRRGSHTYFYKRHLKRVICYSDFKTFHSIWAVPEQSRLKTYNRFQII